MKNTKKPETKEQKASKIDDATLNKLNAKYGFDIKLEDWESTTKQISSLANNINTDLTDIIYKLCVYGKSNESALRHFLKNPISQENNINGLPFNDFVQQFKTIDLPRPASSETRIKLWEHLFQGALKQDTKTLVQAAKLFTNSDLIRPQSSDDDTRLSDLTKHPIKSPVDIKQLINKIKETMYVISDDTNRDIGLDQGRFITKIINEGYIQNNGSSSQDDGPFRQKYFDTAVKALADAPNNDRLPEINIQQGDLILIKLPKGNVAAPFMGLIVNTCQHIGNQVAEHIAKNAIQRKDAGIYVLLRRKNSQTPVHKTQNSNDAAYIQGEDKIPVFIYNGINLDDFTVRGQMYTWLYGDILICDSLDLKQSVLKEIKTNSEYATFIYNIVRSFAQKISQEDPQINKVCLGYGNQKIHPIDKFNDIPKGRNPAEYSKYLGCRDDSTITLTLGYKSDKINKEEYFKKLLSEKKLDSVLTFVENQNLLNNLEGTWLSREILKDLKNILIESASSLNETNTQQKILLLFSPTALKGYQELFFTPNDIKDISANEAEVMFSKEAMKLYEKNITFKDLFDLNKILTSQNLQQLQKADLPKLIHYNESKIKWIIKICSDQTLSEVTPHQLFDRKLHKIKDAWKLHQHGYGKFIDWINLETDLERMFKLCELMEEYKIENFNLYLEKVKSFDYTILNALLSEQMLDQYKKKQCDISNLIEWFDVVKNNQKKYDLLIYEIERINDQSNFTKHIDLNLFKPLIPKLSAEALDYLLDECRKKQLIKVLNEENKKNEDWYTKTQPYRLAYSLKESGQQLTQEDLKFLYENYETLSVCKFEKLLQQLKSANISSENDPTQEQEETKHIIEQYSHDKDAEKQITGKTETFKANDN